MTAIRLPGFVEENKHGANTTLAQYHFFALTLFGLSGFLNTILLLSTRPRSGLFGTLMFISEARPPSPLPAMMELPHVQEENLRQDDPEDVQHLARLP